MEIVANLCAHKKTMHKDHAWWAWCTHGKHHGEWTTRVATGKKFYYLEMKKDVKHLLHTMWSAKTWSPFIKRSMDYTCLYQSQVNHGSVSMDFITQLLKWNEMDAILVVVNQFSKLAKMVPRKTIATTFDSTKLFFDMWIRHHVMLQFIISDRDVKFMTSF